MHTIVPVNLLSSISIGGVWMFVRLCQTYL